jgi:hypothetical protein
MHMDSEAGRDRFNCIEFLKSNAPLKTESSNLDYSNAIKPFLFFAGGGSADVKMLARMQAQRERMQKELQKGVGRDQHTLGRAPHFAFLLVPEIQNSGPIDDEAAAQCANQGIYTDETSGCEDIISRQKG